MSDTPVKVLLVEDDEDDVVLTRQLLAEIGSARYEMEWEADFDRGLDRLCDGAFDVCLVDYYLGLRDGVEFVRQAAARNCDTPVIILTGLGDRTVDVAAMNAGAADFLTKTDLKPADLERSIRYAIQERRVREQRINLLTEQAARARAESANQAKDHFLAALSHELRTPLAPVLIAVEALADEPGLPPEVRESVALIKRNVELEARLIDDLLDLTRVAHRKLEIRRQVVDVHEELRHAAQTCALSGHEGEKRVEVAIHPEARRHHVMGDGARLQQVFWNLIKNAYKFTPAGGRIDVRTSDDPAGTGRLSVEVRDTGMGIDPESLPRIFNAFEQLDQTVTRQFGGLGLGLAICKALVDLHGGTIAAHSEGKGRGATFTVCLPTVDAPTMAAAIPCQPQGMAAAAGSDINTRPATGRILLVEDHPDTRKLMVILLARQGHKVEAAGSLADALAFAAARPFDLVISDIGLPDGSGLDLMPKLRERCESVKGIALSGYGMEQDVRRSHEAGFDEHLTKPVDVRKLQESVRRLLREAAVPSAPTP